MDKLIRITTISESLNTLLTGQLKFLNNYYEVVGVASGKELLKIVEEREGVRTVHIPMRREISIFHDIYSLLLLVKLFKNEKPYIVHANTPKGSLLGMMAAWICKVPFRIYTVTGLRFETTTGLFRKLLIYMERLTCACSTDIIPEGVGVMNTLKKEDITQKPLRVIHNGNINGVDVNYFNPEKSLKEDLIQLRSELNISEDDFVYIFVGRMVGDKGINELILAFNRLSLLYSYAKSEVIMLPDNTGNNNLYQRKTPKLLLVGSFESELDPLQTRTLELINHNSNIITVGYKKDIRPFCAISNCLVFPSYREGFPNVVIQAGAMGLPSIVTNISGCNEIIIDKKNGIIIPPKDESSLHNAMKYFIDNSQIVSEMAKMSRPLVVSRYEQTDVWKALIAEYKKMEYYKLNP